MTDLYIIKCFLDKTPKNNLEKPYFELLEYLINVHENKLTVDKELLKKQALEVLNEDVAEEVVEYFLKVTKSLKNRYYLDFTENNEETILNVSLDNKNINYDYKYIIETYETIDNLLLKFKKEFVNDECKIVIDVNKFKCHRGFCKSKINVIDKLKNLLPKLLFINGDETLLIKYD